MKVGVLDDSSVLRSVTCKILGRDGIESVPLENWEELKARISELNLVLTDISLGDVDGRDVARAVKSLPEPLNQIPLIAVTAFADSGIRESLLEAGFVDYLHKPYRPEELCRKVRHWALQSPRPSE